MLGTLRGFACHFFLTPKQITASGVVIIRLRVIEIGVVYKICTFQELDEKVDTTVMSVP